MFQLEKMKKFELTEDIAGKKKGDIFDERLDFDYFSKSRMGESPYTSIKSICWDYKGGTFEIQSNNAQLLKLISDTEDFVVLSYIVNNEVVLNYDSESKLYTSKDNKHCYSKEQINSDGTNKFFISKVKRLIDNIEFESGVTSFEAGSNYTCGMFVISKIDGNYWTSAKNNTGFHWIPLEWVRNIK